MLRSLSSIRMIATSSFLILPAIRSSSKNRLNSSSHFASKSFCVQPSPFSRRCKYHEATASDISNNTSPLSKLPESITIDGMLLSCRDESEATSIGAVLKLSERERGKLLISAPPRQCSRQASPSAIAFQEGKSELRSSSTPTKAANDPARAFSSEYHERFRPFQES